VFGLPAVALAAGKLMKLPPDKLAQAVNLAINDHIPMGQTRTQTLSDWKGLAAAEAGRNAVFAAMLARGPVRRRSSKDAKASSSWCRGQPKSTSMPSAAAAWPSASTSAA
jgi:MmgE/PrpD N-terminal domain